MYAESNVDAFVTSVKSPNVSMASASRHRLSKESDEYPISDSSDNDTEDCEDDKQ
jgi:hypothetical protein